MSLLTFRRNFLYVQRKTEKEGEFLFPTSQPKEAGQDGGSELDRAPSKWGGSGHRLMRGLDAGMVQDCAAVQG